MQHFCDSTSDFLPDVLVVFSQIIGGLLNSLSPVVNSKFSQGVEQELKNHKTVCGEDPYESFGTCYSMLSSTPVSLVRLL